MRHDLKESSNEILYAMSKGDAVQIEQLYKMEIFKFAAMYKNWKKYSKK